MTFEPLPFSASLNDYERQAQQLFEGHKSGDSRAIEIFHQNHPRFLDEKIKWLPKNLSEDDIKASPLDIDDARLALARGYCFKDWQALEEYAQAAARSDSAVFRFESAVEAVITGALDVLKRSLTSNPELVHARSTRVTKFDPPVHRATLLHYLGANGVEGCRQRTPKNAVEIARALLDAGAEADALADLYGGECTTMSLLVSSTPPAEAGLQVPLLETLLDYGASLTGRGSTRWRSPLMTALVFGFIDAAEALVRRGAPVDNLAAAAGLGRISEVIQLLEGADAEARHRALALAAQLGQTEVVGILLDAGEDPDRYNPEGSHAHATPLHHAALAGHEGVVRLLVERGARLDIKDTIYHSTPLGWAFHGGKTAIAEYLRDRDPLRRT